MKSTLSASAYPCKITSAETQKRERNVAKKAPGRSGFDYKISVQNCWLSLPERYRFPARNQRRLPSVFPSKLHSPESHKREGGPPESAHLPLSRVTHKRKWRNQNRSGGCQPQEPEPTSKPTQAALLTPPIAGPEVGKVHAKQGSKTPDVEWCISPHPAR